MKTLEFRVEGVPDAPPWCAMAENVGDGKRKRFQRVGRYAGFAAALSEALALRSRGRGRICMVKMTVFFENDKPKGEK